MVRILQMEETTVGARSGVTLSCVMHRGGFCMTMSYAMHRGGSGQDGNAVQIVRAESIAQGRRTVARLR